MTATPSKRLLKLAKQLVYRRYIARATQHQEDFHRVLEIKIKHDYYLDQHQSRTMDRVVRVREEMEL